MRMHSSCVLTASLATGNLCSTVWLMTTTAVSMTPSQYNPAPTASPTADVAHMPAAVVSPLMEEEFRSLKITPAPRKEIPLTTWAAIRAGSALRRPSTEAISTKAYFDRIMMVAEVTAMMQCVRIPASFCRRERSSPIIRPSSAAIRIRMRNSRLSQTVKRSSGK